MYRPIRGGAHSLSAASYLHTGVALAAGLSALPSEGSEMPHLNVGMLMYPRMDQIDFTGPFEALSRRVAARLGINAPK